MYPRAKYAALSSWALSAFYLRMALFKSGYDLRQEVVIQKADDLVSFLIHNTIAARVQINLVQREEFFTKDNLVFFI